MNTRALIYAACVATVCAAAVVTVSTWPPVDARTWEPAAPLAWWQFEWLASLGVLLVALPSWIVFNFDRWLAHTGQLRDVVSIILVVAEIMVVCLGVYRAGTLFGWLLRRSSLSPQQTRHNDARSLRASQ